MKIRILLLLAAMYGTTAAFAQSDKLGMGFRAGLTMSQLHGPLETGAQGEEVESYSNATGFHIGFMVNYKFTDLVGLQSGLTFSQRGTKYDFEGDSYYLLGRYTSRPLLLKEGIRTQTQTVTNAFLDIPLMVYYKFGNFEIMGGANAGLLIGSTGGGTMSFAGKSPVTGNPVLPNPFEVLYQHNYLKDDAMGASSTLQDILVDGVKYQVPTSTGAYYEFEEKTNALYNTLDFGLVGNLSYFLNDGLFISARYLHGITDIDLNDYDVSLTTLEPNGEPVKRADKNTTRTWQFSIGFSF